MNNLIGASCHSWGAPCLSSKASWSNEASQLKQADAVTPPETTDD